MGCWMASRIADPRAERAAGRIFRPSEQLEHAPGMKIPANGRAPN